LVQLVFGTPSRLNSLFLAASIAALFTLTIPIYGLGVNDASFEHSVIEVVQALEKLSKTRTLTADEVRVLLMAKVSRDALDMKVVFLDPNDGYLVENSPAKTRPSSFSGSIQNIIMELNDWEKPLSTAAFSEVSSNREALEKAFESSPIDRAWLLYKLGEKKAAKTIFFDYFEQRFNEEMANPNLQLYGQSYNFLVQVQKMIAKVSSISEMIDQERKMKELESHAISTTYKGAKWKAVH
jgi:hypothetical protein